MAADPNHEPDSDAALLDRARAGDLDAFERLYRRHRDWVARVAMRCCGHEEDALDVLQETFVYLLRRMPSLTLTGRLTTFLYPAIKNHSIRARQRSRRAAPGDAGLTDQPGHTPREAHPQPLEAAVDALPEHYREPLIMRFIDGMSIAEIALALEIPEGTVKSRLHHATKTLRQDPRLSAHFG